jgi:ATP-binding cassette subfamily B protein
MRKEKASEKGKAWLKREMRPYRASIVFITIISVLTTLSSLAFAYLVRYLVGGAIERNVDSIVLLSCILLAILAVKIISSVLYSYFTERQRCKMIAKERKKIYGRLLHSDYEKLAEFHSGDLLNRITSDLTEVVVDTVSLMPTLVGIGVQCVGAIAALLTLDPLFTAIYVVCGALGGGLMAIFRKRVAPKYEGWVHAIGLILLLALMAFVMFNDVRNLF